MTPRRASYNTPRVAAQSIVRIMQRSKWSFDEILGLEAIPMERGILPSLVIAKFDASP
jgi:hypothetical protein